MNRLLPSALLRRIAALVVASSRARRLRRRWRRRADAAATNADPVAAFTAPDSVVAGSAARFDAAASSDTDGDALTYSWEFSGGGGARRGGGVKIAQAFAAPGTYTVKLTVADGRGGVASATRTLDVTPGAASTGTVDTLIVVRDRSGAPLPAVSVTNADSGAVATTAADGRATLATRAASRACCG
jgi:PKD repeat protein